MVYECITDDDVVNIAPSTYRLKRFWTPLTAFSLACTSRQVRNECLHALVRRQAPVKFVLPPKSRGSLRVSPDSFSQVNAFINSLDKEDRRRFLSKPLHFVGTRRGDGHLAESMMQLFPDITSFHMDMEYATSTRLKLFPPSHRIRIIRRGLQYLTRGVGHWVDTKLDDVRVRKGLYLHKARFTRLKSLERLQTVGSES